MSVSVKEYLNSMKNVGSSAPTNNSSNDTKTQALLSNLIEAIAYANSIDFRKKTLNSTAPGQDKETGKQVLETLKAQEKLIDELASGQKLSEEQNKKLISAIDKFYELASSSEINYKKFAAQLEKFALNNKNLPEPVQTRLINDSRDAHMIGQQANAASSPILKILKSIKYLAQDSFEMSKQFGKKLFVSLDAFKEGLLGAFDKLKDAFEDNSIISNVVDALKSMGLAWMLFQGQFKEGNFKFGQAFKQFDNIKTALKAFKDIANLGEKAKGPIKAIKDLMTGAKLIGKGLSEIPKVLKGLSSFGKIGTTIGRGITKGLGKGVLKKVPVIGTLMSLWMAYERWQKKDYMGAFLEIGSGIAAMFPGLGTLISIGIDLVNLGRDSGVLANLGKSASNAVSNTIQKIPDSMILAIPGIGTIFGLVKSINLFKSNNKKEGMKMLGSAIASIIPGGGLLANALYSLLDLNVDVNPSTNAEWTPPTIKKQKPGTSGQKIDDYVWNEGPFGDAPIKWQNESGGYSPNGLTQSAKTAANNLNNLIGGGLTVTSAYRDPNKMMGLWNSAKPIPGSRNRINIYGNEMADPRRSNHRFGTAIDIPMSLYKRIGAKKFKKLANQAGFNLVYPERSAVHLEVPKSGKVAKVDSNSIDAKSNIEPFGENQDKMTAYAEVQQAQSFEDIMNMFNKFNEEIVANVTSGSASQTSTMSAPSVESMSSGTPQAAIASSTAKTANSIQQINKAPMQQAPKTMPINVNNQDGLDTEIRDTDIALLNSILFQ